MQVTLDGVGHRFDGQPWLFRRLSFTLSAGRVYALTGPSGSGKSTLLSILAGWEEPVEGVVQRDGIHRIGWVLQNPHGVPRRSALDLVAFPFLALGSSPVAAEARATALLRKFGLGEVGDREFRSLSGGEAQRLMLARAIAADPALLLIDEPTAQLDPESAGTVNEALGRMSRSGTIVVVATHDPRTRDACSDHLDLAVLGASNGASGASAPGAA